MNKLSLTSRAMTPLRGVASRDDREIQPHDTSVPRILLKPNRHGHAADPLLGTRDHDYTPSTTPRNGHLVDLIVLTPDIPWINLPAQLLTWKTTLPCGSPPSAPTTHIINHPLATSSQDVNIASRDADNPTHLMALAFSKYATSEAILKGAEALLSAGADPIARNSHELTLLHRLASTGDAPLVSLLLSHGADPRLTEAEGKQAFHYAAASGH
ncbi:hypothetical protein B0T14DRAFT_501206 [Immersiella caudata]|uniref:Uncharacterized protein n=1 Tax=Immersiella caudata TaxID=314043 RepID=A0AA39TJH5_9PEZI|nr:hypothetical protein B0T14DRAFT_501206 [Immersiella caudata]